MKDTKSTSAVRDLDLLALGKKLLKRKMFIFKAVGISLIIGIIIAFSIPKEYTTTVILTPEAQTNSSGTTSSLAALAGINLNSNFREDPLASPNLYPTIFNSTIFLKGLFDIPIKEDTINTDFYTYIKEYEKGPWWGYIIKIPSSLRAAIASSDSKTNVKNESPRVISKEEEAIIQSLRSKLAVNSDKKTEVTTIEVTMQNPEVSALIADTLISYLQTYIIGYRTQKAREDLIFAEKLHREAKENYNKAQADLASFIDGNMNVVSAKYRITQDRLQNEANLAYSVYNQTAQQLQMAKLKVQNTTPVFTIIQPAIEPLQPSKPSKKLILVVFLFLSFIGSTIWILKKDIWYLLINKNTEKSIE